MIESAELGGTIYVGHGVSAAPDAVVWAAVRPEKIDARARRRREQRTTDAQGVDQGNRLHGRHVASTSCSSTPARPCASRSPTRTGTPTTAHVGRARVGAAGTSPAPWSSPHERSAAAGTLRHPRQRISSGLGSCWTRPRDLPPYRGRAGVLRRWGVTGRTARHRHPVALAAAVLPDPVPHRSEDQLRGYAARRCRRTRRSLTGRSEQHRCRCKLNVGNYPVPVEGLALLCERS